MIIEYYKPHSLRINNDTCTDCGSTIKKSLGRSTVRINECDSCSYDDRPFGYCRKDKNPCTCEFKEIDTLDVTCMNCIGNQAGKMPTIFSKNGPSRPLFVYFRSYQTNINTILQQISVKKCQSSIRHWDSNLQNMSILP